MEVLELLALIDSQSSDIGPRTRPRAQLCFSKHPIGSIRADIITNLPTYIPPCTPGNCVANMMLD